MATKIIQIGTLAASISFGALICCANSAFALTFNEGSDFPNGISYSTNPSVGTLDLGVNVVNGSLSGVCVASLGSFDCSITFLDEQDSFLFSVAPGNQVDSIYITTSNVSGPAGFSAGSGREKQNVAGFAFDPLVLNGTTANILSAAIFSGVYSQSIFAGLATEAGEFSFDYSIEYNVSQVSSAPLPGTLSLFTAGLGALGLFGWRRKKKAAAFAA